jgi:hypothetical protein
MARFMAVIVMTFSAGKKHCGIFAAESMEKDGKTAFS